MKFEVFLRGAVKEVHIAGTKFFQVGIHSFVNNYNCKDGDKNAFVHSIIEYSTNWGDCKSKRGKLEYPEKNLSEQS